MQIEISQTPSQREWNQVLSQLGEGNYRQTWEYGEAVCLSRKRTKVMRIIARKNGDSAVGVLQGIIRGRAFLGGELLCGGSSGGGPSVIPDVEDRGIFIEAIMREARRYAREMMVRRIRLHWYERMGRKEIFDGLHFRALRKAQMFFIDLNKGAGMAWDNFEGNKRRNVRKAERAGTEVKVSQNLDELEEFYRMYSTFAREKGFNPIPIREIKNIWKGFLPKNWIRVFTAWKGKERVATALVINHLDTLFCPYTCSNQAGRRVRANDLLHWKIIEWGCNNDLKKYNMGEVFTDTSSDEFGVFRWKRGFGGFIDSMIIYENVVNPWLEGLRQIAKKGLKIVGSRQVKKT